MKKVLLLVSKTLLREHVGVKRVSLFYYQELRSHNVEVSLAFYDSGEFFLFQDSDEILEFEGYSLEQKFNKKEVNHKKIDPDDFDLTIISCPWLIDQNFPKLKSSAGIVLDMIPNLLAMNIIRFPGSYVECSRFAHEHLIGYEYYKKTCTKIISISHQTTNDFIETFHEPALSEKFLTILPFANRSSIEHHNPRSSTILLVNCLDPRKNFEVACRTLSKLNDIKNFNVVLVGKPRGSDLYLKNCFSYLEDSNIQFVWKVHCSDEELQNLYTSSKALFFPSIYEGLGLPILEAQSRNCPVITSNSSSCIEITFFPELASSPTDIEGFASSLRIVLENDRYPDEFFNLQWNRLLSRYDTINSLLSVI